VRPVVMCFEIFFINGNTSFLNQ
jgi:hypothetical protein